MEFDFSALLREGYTIVVDPHIYQVVGGERVPAVKVTLFNEDTGYCHVGRGRDFFTAYTEVMDDVRNLLFNADKDEEDDEQV